VLLVGLNHLCMERFNVEVVRHILNQVNYPPTPKAMG